MPNVRVMPRTTVIGAYDGGTFGALERVAEHMACAAQAPLTASGGSRRGGRCFAPGRSSGRSPFRQRPAGGDAGGRGAGLPEPLGGSAGAGGGLHRQRRRLAHGGRPRGGRGRGHRPCRRAGRRDAAAGPWRSFTGAAVVGTRGRRGLRAVLRAAGRARAPAGRRRLAVAGGWNPARAPDLAPGAGRSGTRPRGLRGRRRGRCRGWRRPGRRRGPSRRTRRLPGGAGCRRRRCATSGSRAAAPSCRRPRTLRVRGRRSGRWRAAGAGVARPPERRDGEGRRPGGAGELPLGRAHEALHHPRHGDRPGQDRGRRGARRPRRADRPRRRRDRHDDLPPALHSGADRGARGRRRRRGLRAAALYSGARRDGGRAARRSSRRPWYRPSWFPAPGETTWHPGLRPRGGHGAARGRRLRRDDLGKIDVQGPDAAAFLDRVYANRSRRCRSGGCATG